MDPYQEKKIDELRDYIKVLIKLTCKENLIAVKEMINQELKEREETIEWNS